MVAWTPRTHALQLVRDIHHKDKKLVIQWAQWIPDANGNPTAKLDEKMKGTPDDLAIYVRALEQFIKAYGGPGDNSPTQWAADGINKVSNGLFNAALDLWGYPKLVDKTK
jgi:hypothetical protein